MNDEMMKQAMAYFKGRSAFQKLFMAMRDKYRSLGQLGGRFVLSGLSPEERRQLEGFLRKDVGKSGEVTVTYRAAEKALLASRFGNLQWEDILEAYFGEPLFSNREQRDREAELHAAYWESVIAQCGNDRMKEWLAALAVEKKAGYRILEQQYREDKDFLKEVLEKLEAGLYVLQGRGKAVCSLPIFAAKSTGNPHFFDEGTVAGRLLFQYAEYYYGQSVEKGDLTDVERKEQLLYRLGMERDGMSNTCMMYGILARKEDGTVHGGIQGYYKERQAHNVTLNTLAGLSELRPGMDGCNVVYILENPAVFSFLVSRYPEHAFLCTNGQMKLSGYAALDLFPEACRFSYAGDFDPEGLQIAQKLKSKYKGRLQFWNYRREYYEKHLSNVELDEKRIKKLDGIQDAGLMDIKEGMLVHRRAAYQESMLEVYRIEGKAMNRAIFVGNKD